ncbi:antitoxin [Nocardioides humilatus]|uniref:Antitoxin n=1 Tax=Nocardioides humilatus TaxID=2607660 RepID=A0A5B1L909_9ACTN|nr:antitoxin [Nocardioides humilatus]KAA1416794.1 antitoxin [Nocardioides humilatus]
MRTSVTLDPDVEQIIRERMSGHGVSFERALNDAIRESRSVRREIAFETMTSDTGAPRVDLTKANQLAGELEDDAIIEKMRHGR